jgi:ELAV like protein 2/3/4
MKMNSSGSSESVGNLSQTESTCATTATSTTSTQSSTYIESKTNLIINYLPATLAHDEFKQLFVSYGELESCRLVCDKHTGQSLCYGFVNYVHADDADKAYKSVNGLKIHNKMIKVSFARPSCESIKGANLYVCGIPKNWTEIELNQYFSQCGHIITSRILLNQQNGTSKGDGFIRFDKRDEALYAISKLNGTRPTNDSKDTLTVKMANYNDPKTFSTNSQILPQHPKAYLNVNSLKRQVSTMNLLQKTLDLNMVPRNPFINSLNSTTTPTPIPQTQSNTIDFPLTTLNDSHQRLFPITQIMPNLGWCLFVYNLPPEADEVLLWQLFGPFGAIQNIKVIRDLKTKTCKGFSFVTMTNYDDAVLAITALNGYTLGNRILQVSFKTNSLF